MTQNPSRQIARDDHYVPRSLLRRWSLDGKNVYAYRLLVSRSSVREWEWRAIRGLAYQRDLYTLSEGGRETDDLERWLSTEFEQPGSRAIDKVLKDARLKRKDRRSLARLLAAQDLRTLVAFRERKHHWERDLPHLLMRTLQESLQKLAEAQRTGLPLVVPPVPENEFSKLLRIEIERPANPEAQTMIRAEMETGRSLWIAEIRHLLTGVAEVLCRHPWSIVEPGDKEEWPLTDHPVLKLNYNGPDQYDFGGGWGRRGTDIMMPLSPRKLLFVEVGKDAGRAVKFTPERTWLVRRLLCERAHRWIFATQPKGWVSEFRPREVDAEAFEAEAQAWERWPREQSQSDMSVRDKEQ